MALGDRSYMRTEYNPPTVCTRLIIILIVAFVIQSALLFYGEIDVYKHLALSRAGLLHGKVWQLTIEEWTVRGVDTTRSGFKPVAGVYDPG